MTPRVLIVVLTYNGAELTLACLASLAKLDRPGADVIVVDNASTDNTAARVSEGYPSVVLIETGSNLGYAGGNNFGLRYAWAHGYDYALLLNNDTEVAPDFVTHLVDVCEREPDIGAAGPKITLFDRPNIIYTAGGSIDWRNGTTETVGLGEEDRGQYDALRDVDFVNGCAILVRRVAVEQAGLIDARFGMYFEETEWCVRIARAGWRLTYVPTSVVRHKIQLERHDLSPRVTYYMARNRLLFLRLTRAPLGAWLNAMVAQDLRTWLSWRIRPKWRGRQAQRIAIQHGWRDFFRGRFGMAET
jgi:GT2 family glycosyltransferase